MSPAKIERIIYIGDFSITGNAIIASDPSFRAPGMDEQVILQPCEKGTWHAFVEDDTAHTFKLIAISANADPDLADWQIWIGGSLVVQTCQAGLFDFDKYQIDENFYQTICDMTSRQHSDQSVSKLEGVEGWCFGSGAVTGTATEEGKHLCYTMKQSDGTIYGIAIVFYKSYTKWSDISLRKIMLNPFAQSSPPELQDQA